MTERDRRLGRGRSAEARNWVLERVFREGITFAKIQLVSKTVLEESNRGARGAIQRALTLNMPRGSATHATKESKGTGALEISDAAIGNVAARLAAAAGWCHCCTICLAAGDTKDDQVAAESFADRATGVEEEEGNMLEFTKNSLCS